MSSDKRKLALILYFEDAGFDARAAGRCALMMSPLDDAVKPSRRFRKEARRVSGIFARGLKEQGMSGWQERHAVDALKFLRATAQQMGEDYYVRKYDAALTWKIDTDPAG